MYPVLPLAPSSYTLHVFTIDGPRWRPSKHIARLMTPDGQVRSEWTTTCYTWWLPWKVASLRYSLDGLLDYDDVLPVHYATIDPPTGGKLQLSFAMQLNW